MNEVKDVTVFADLLVEFVVGGATEQVNQMAAENPSALDASKGRG